MRVLAFDLGLNAGFASLARGARPLAGSVRLDGSAEKLGAVAISFEQFASEIIAEQKPDVIGYAAPFVGAIAMKNPNSIKPLFGLMMALEAMADRRRIRCVMVTESDARKAFLGKVPAKSKAIKEAVIAGCRSRNWPAATDHAADALVVADFILSILEPETAHAGDPLFATAPAAPSRRRRARRRLAADGDRTP